MNLAYLILGSNIGYSKDHLGNAVVEIQKNCGKLLKKSAIYETAAWGKTNQPAYLNQVLFIQTHLLPEILLQTILQVEKDMGRIRTEKYAARIIDIDILFYNQEIIDKPFLKIPHPEMPYRRFVLTPLAEIVPNKIHPVLKKSIAHLLEECADTLPVKMVAS